MGITQSGGNVIFPSGNALKYLSEYFNSSQQIKNPYEENPEDIRAISISSNGDTDTFDGNVYRTDVITIIENYTPKNR